MRTLKRAVITLVVLGCSAAAPAQMAEDVSRQALSQDLAVEILGAASAAQVHEALFAVGALLFGLGFLPRQPRAESASAR